MKLQLTIAVGLALLVMLAGCVQTPRQKGTWTGVVATTTSNSAKPHKRFVLNIEQGPKQDEGAKARGQGGKWPHEFLAAHPILTGKNDKLLQLPDLVGHRVRVHGTIHVGTSPYFQDWSAEGWTYVIEVNNVRKSIHDVGKARELESFPACVRRAEFIGVISITNAATTNTQGGVKSRYGYGTIERMLKGVQTSNPFRVRQNITQPDHVWKQLDRGRYLMFGFYSGASIAPFGYYGLIPISKDRRGIDLVSWPKSTTLTQAIAVIEENIPR